MFLPRTTHRALRGDYSLHNCPTTQSIGKIVKKLEETAVDTIIERLVHDRFVRSAENIGPNVFSSSFSGIVTVLRHFMWYFTFRSTPTSI